MEPLTEFYLTTMWIYRKAAVKRIIERLNSTLYQDAQFMYDDEYHWFHVKCRPEDRLDIREQFGIITSDIEIEAFGDDTSEILNPDGTIKESFDNDLVIYEAGSFENNRGRVENARDAYSFPSAFANFAHTAVWSKLEDVNLTIHNIANPEEFSLLQTETRVKMEYNLSGKLVYLGGNSAEFVKKATEKLEVLLAIQTSPPPRTEHILYAEDYVEKGLAELTVDVRYMANIHPRLPSTTLLDPICITNLEKAYQRIHEQGASLRLCKYDESRGQHYSLLGPEIKGRGGQRYPLGNRPSNFVKAMDASHDPFNQRDKPVASHQIILADRTANEVQVSKWMEDIPESLDSNLETQNIPTSGPDDTSRESTADQGYTEFVPPNSDCAADKIIDDIRSIAEGSGLPAAKEEQFRSLLDKLSIINKSSSPLSQTTTLARNTPPYAASSTLEDRINIPPGLRTPIDDETWENPVLDDRPIPLPAFKTLRMPQSQLGNHKAPESLSRSSTFKSIDSAESVSFPRTVAPKNPLSTEIGSLSKSAASNFIKAKPRRTPPITWSMAPLIPERVHVNVDSGRSTKPTATDHVENEDRFKRYNEPGAKGVSTMNQQAKSRRVLNSSGMSSTTAISPLGPKGVTSQGPRPQELVPKSQLVVAQEFIEEIDATMHRLLVSCPYKRGTVTVRADFGRAIVADMDETALAFNNSKTPSQGWAKTRLVQNLNAQVTQRHRIHFTKVLSTFGSDLESMINMNDEQSKTRLWQPTPHKSWISYSFYCLYREGKSELPFIVECKYEEDDNNFSYEIRPFNSVNDGVTPLYVHGIQRNWDLRITLTHTENDLEEVLGKMVRSFLRSVHISRLEVDGTELKFALGDGNMFVREARILTKWRYHSEDTKSILEITEVEPLVTVQLPVAAGKRRQYRAQSPNKREKRSMENAGKFPRWYEASVLSTEFEEKSKQNKTLCLGEKTDWDVDTLKEHGVFGATYGPALQMLKKMDHVGGNECNNMPASSQFEVRRRNDEQVVPGYTQAPPVASPSSSKAPAGNKQPMNQSSPQQQGWGGQSQHEQAKAARWKARMEATERAGKVFW